MKFIKSLTVITFLFLSSTQILAQYPGWTMKGGLQTLRAGATATVIDDKIYVFGGTTADVDMAITEVYDPATNTWATKALMPTPRGFLTSESVNGIVYVIGGGYMTLTKKNEAYNPADNTWTAKADMPDQRLGMKAAMVNGIIYVIGGNYNDGSCFAYNPTTNTWTQKSSMPPGAGGTLSVTAYNNLIYTFGGSTYSPWAALASVYAYDPQTDTWVQKYSMPTPRFAFHTYLINGKIYALGGSKSMNTTLKSFEVYDPANNSWQVLPDMPVSVTWHTGAVVNNKLYVITGTTDWVMGLQQLWEYDPSVVNVKEEKNIPASFTLYQNHPNPFNPTTTIKYSIPSASNVTLKVFDILGNEIETLINEEKPSGIYSITWNAANYSNGVYFYKLQAGRFVETKKMLLMK